MISKDLKGLTSYLLRLFLKAPQHQILFWGCLLETQDEYTQKVSFRHEKNSLYISFIVGEVK